MIHAYSTESAIPNKALFKRNVDAAFEDLVIGERAVTLNKKSAYLIQAIDGSKLLNSLNVEAISGETIGIEKLSTGCSQ